MLHREGEYLDVGGIPNISVLSHVVQMKKHALPIQEVYLYTLDPVMWIRIDCMRIRIQVNEIPKLI